MTKDKPYISMTLPNETTADVPEQAGAQSLKKYITDFMVKVPGFRPPEVPQENYCPLPNCSQEDLNEFRSAGVLLKAIASEAKAWAAKLPPNYRPAIMALLHGGVQVQVHSLAQVSFDGIRVEGMMGESPCSILAHQDTIQLVCHAICTDPEEEEPHPIGFIWPDHKEKV
jgi:hypothetical protein